MRSNWKKELINALNIKDIKKVQSLVAPHVPKKLYRYCPISESTITGLKENYIRFSHPSQFNDPYDSSAILVNELLPDGWENEMKKANTTP